MRTTVLSREQWGADPELPKRGHQVSPSSRTEVFIHHSVVFDDDGSPNEWESLAEVKARMRGLQTIRPDLGLDVPYSMVAFCMSGGDLVLCEGRGLFRSGAHTIGHNRSALGIAFQGNFEDERLPARFDDQLAALGGWLRELREEQGFVHLGDERPPGRDVWGHRDVKATACPGRALFERLPLVRFLEEEDNDAMMDKETWEVVQRALQSLDPPLYAGQDVDGKPGPKTNTAVRAFERRMGLKSRGVLGELLAPDAGIWPATRELLFARSSPGANG